MSKDIQKITAPVKSLFHQDINMLTDSLGLTGRGGPSVGEKNAKGVVDANAALVSNAPPVPVVPVMDQAAMEAARKKAAAMSALTGGRASTILTGGTPGDRLGG